MDPSLVDAMMPSLTAAVTAYGANVLVRAEDAAAVETVRLGQRLLARLRRNEVVQPRIDVAVQDLASALDDEDFLGALRAQIKKALTEDADLASDLKNLLAGSHVTVQATGTRSVAVTHNNGVISTGDNATIQR
ncbi:hypothetical protein GCM10017744_027730 [Streptomyces antimycoticus]|uniref:Uncharacterized protein n=1 Tax=Streptomyces antimycoticus TaxID=68175 RepID=A0A4D4KBP2_9ACTN|nr:hypothetical protein [Streptomyces antimycoticus]GDY46581.1 hypothetical protein SANT12839_074630 [Streptomyces antimycoticus]